MLGYAEILLRISRLFHEHLYENLTRLIQMSDQSVDPGSEKKGLLARVRHTSTVLIAQNLLDRSPTGRMPLVRAWIPGSRSPGCTTRLSNIEYMRRKPHSSMGSITSGAIDQRRYQDGILEHQGVATTRQRRRKALCHPTEGRAIARVEPGRHGGLVCAHPRRHGSLVHFEPTRATDITRESIKFVGIF